MSLNRPAFSITSLSKFTKCFSYSPRGEKRERGREEVERQTERFKEK